MNRRTIYLLSVLCLMGAGWGMTQPLSKIAVSGGYRHFGLVFWQMAIGCVALGLFRSIRLGERSGRFSVSLRAPRLRTDPPALLVYVVIALIGTVLPNSASYEAIRHLPSGLVSILLSLVPMFAFPIALALGNERFDLGRFAGLALGLVGVLLIVAPEASLPERAMVVFIPLAMIAPLFYGLEGNVVDRWGTAGLSAVEVLFGASLVGACISLVPAVLGGHFIDPRPPWDWPDLALLLASLIHVVVYTAYVWMVRAAGPVFAVQVSYLVTGFGVLWAMWILGESYSGWIWAAMVLILTGVFLVQPRGVDALAEDQ
ncbi:MAG: DMT family transporter, partial [Silicimonas sp.]|nr:DMT family transporter [Silicimonas sp.]